MIICGFPGVGKSMMARFGHAIDLESTPFEKDWMRYAKVAKHMHDSGYLVMVSTHKELLDCFEQMEVPYTVVVPRADDLETYVRRYEARGNSAEFVKKVVENWDEWLRQIHSISSVLKTLVILPKDGCLKAWFDEVNNDY